MKKITQKNNLKRFLTIAGFVLMIAAGNNVFSQNGVGINPSGAPADPSAAVDVSSTTKGFLPPRMTAGQRDAIVAPAQGLMVYCTDCGVNGGEPEYYNGSTWKNMVGGSAALPAIGKNYGGGILFYLLQSGDPGYDANVPHGLIAATSDQSTGATWDNGSNIYYVAIGYAIGTGMANTNAIIAAQGNTGTYAAKLCRDYAGGGFNDWYLPSKNEQNLMYINIGQGAPSPNTNVGGFASTYYWSSTLYTPGFAYGDNFSGGSQTSGGTYNALHVRAIRSF